MKGNGKVGDADGLDNGQDHRALNVVASAVFAVRFGGSDIKIGNIAGA